MSKTSQGWSLIVAGGIVGLWSPAFAHHVDGLTVIGGGLMLWGVFKIWKDENE